MYMCTILLRSCLWNDKTLGSLVQRSHEILYAWKLPICDTMIGGEWLLFCNYRDAEAYIFRLHAVEFHLVFNIKNNEGFQVRCWKLVLVLWEHQHQPQQRTWNQAGVGIDLGKYDGFPVACVEGWCWMSSNLSIAVGVDYLHVTFPFTNTSP